LAATWRVIGSDQERELSIDTESVVRDGSIVTYWHLYKYLKTGGKIDSAITQSKIDCSLRLRRTIYIIEYYRDGSNGQSEIDSGWKPIAPGTVTDLYRRYLCEG
jgi:hypothetical protein